MCTHSENYYQYEKIVSISVSQRVFLHNIQIFSVYEFFVPPCVGFLDIIRQMNANKAPEKFLQNIFGSYYANSYIESLRDFQLVDRTASFLFHFPNEVRAEWDSSENKWTNHYKVVQTLAHKKIIIAHRIAKKRKTRGAK